VKAKDTQDVTETVEITDEVDEEQQIRNEVCPLDLWFIIVLTCVLARKIER
jgi:hypothetical protein